MGEHAAMRIAFDIDNVLGDIISSARAALARDHGVPVESIGLTGIYYNPFSIDDGSGDRLIPLDHAFWDRDDVLTGSPVIPGAVGAVTRVAEAGSLAGYVTRRPGSVRGVTQQWLDRGGFPAAPLHHVGTNDASTTYDVCKSSACREIGATHLIDDHATEIDKARRNGIDVVVVDAEIGRAARRAILVEHPEAILARDVAHAVEILLGPAR
jgi:hypothetical protein